MEETVRQAYEMVARDLDQRSRRAQQDNRPNRRFIQSLENARAVLVREAGLEEWT